MKTLELRFENEVGGTSTITIQDPIEPVNAETVSTVMDTIIAEEALTSNSGDFVKKKSARLVERIVEDIEITE